MNLLRSPPCSLADALTEVADAVVVAVVWARGHVKCPNLLGRDLGFGLRKSLRGEQRQIGDAFGGRSMGG